MKNNGKPLTLRVDQVKEKLSCSAALVYELLEARELKGLRVGLGKKRGGLRVMADSVDEFLRRRCLEYEHECLGLEIPSTVSTVSTDPAEN